MIKCGIYKITNPVGLIYVGQSTNIPRRIIAHKTSKPTTTLISKSIYEYGFSAHKIEIIELCSKTLLMGRERYWQDELDSYNSGLNLILSKTKTLKGSSNPILIEAMRMSNLGRPKTGMHSDEFKESQRLKLKGTQLNPHHNKRIIIQLSKIGEHLKEWESLSEACKYLKINIGNTGDCANGKRKTSGGFKWKYKN